MTNNREIFECIGCGYELPLDNRVVTAIIDCPNCGPNRVTSV